MIPVPSLAEVVEDPDRLVGLPFHALWSLLSESGRIEKSIVAAMIPAAEARERAREEDQILTLDQAADHFNISRRTLQRMLRDPRYAPAVVLRSRTLVRVSAAKLRELLMSGASRRKAG